MFYRHSVASLSNNGEKSCRTRPSRDQVRIVLVLPAAQAFVRAAGAAGAGVNVVFRDVGVVGIEDPLDWRVPPGDILAFIHVVQRRLQLLTEFKNRADAWEVTAHGRDDFLVENTDALVKITDISLDQTADAYTV